MVQSFWPIIAGYAAPVRIGIFLLGLGLMWLPLALPIYGFGQSSDPNLASIVALTVLYMEFLFWAWYWRCRLYGDRQPFQSYGLAWQSQWVRGLVMGLAIGLAGILILFGLEVLWGWATWNPAAPLTLRLCLEGLAVALGIGFAEELLFRGWLLSELERDYRWAIAMGSQSTVFAIAHFIRPLSEILASAPQFIGLVLLGITLAIAKRVGSGQPGSLGLPMGLHAGLVAGYYWVAVGNLIIPTHRVPAWVVGLNQNPLAGLLGLVLLSAIAGGLHYYQTHRPSA